MHEPIKWGAPSDLSLMTDLICGSSPTESLVVHQLGYTGLLSTHCTAGLLGPQLNGPEFGILSVKHHQLLSTGSCRARSRKRPGWCIQCQVLVWVLQCKKARQKIEQCIHNSLIRVLIGMANEESAEYRDCRQNISACFYFILSDRHKTALSSLTWLQWKPFQQVSVDASRWLSR